jgi:hypothetical protein
MISKDVSSDKDFSSRIKFYKIMVHPSFRVGEIQATPKIFSFDGGKDKRNIAVVFSRSGKQSE